MFLGSNLPRPAQPVPRVSYGKRQLFGCFYGSSLRICARNTEEQVQKQKVQFNVIFHL